MVFTRNQTRAQQLLNEAYFSSSLNTEDLLTSEEFLEEEETALPVVGTPPTPAFPLEPKKEQEEDPEKEDPELGYTPLTPPADV